jgi:hypothetical protein
MKNTSEAKRDAREKGPTPQPDDSGVSVSINWKRGGWVLAALIAGLGVARLLGFI